MTRYNHAFDVAFSIETEHDGEHVTADELLDGIRSRLRDLERRPVEVLEACGLPWDTYEIED